jgi:hypothetical protein
MEESQTHGEEGEALRAERLAAARVDARRAVRRLLAIAIVMLTAAAVGVVALLKAGEDPTTAAPTAEGTCPAEQPVRGVAKYDSGSPQSIYKFQLPPDQAGPASGRMPARACFATPMEAGFAGYGEDLLKIGRDGSLERQRMCVGNTLDVVLQFNAGRADEVELSDRLRAVSFPGDLSPSAFTAVVSSRPQEAWPAPQPTDLRGLIDQACMDQALAAGMPNVRSLLQ